MAITDAQKHWLEVYPDFEPVGPPRAGVSFTGTGTLYADGRFEKMGSMKVIRLEPGCFAVGRREKSE